MALMLSKFPGAPDDEHQPEPRQLIPRAFVDVMRVRVEKAMVNNFILGCGGGVYVLEFSVWELYEFVI